MTETVRIYEVGPRDGLQNEALPIATADKRRFIEALLAAGLREIEATSFVRPDRIPQLADADELLPSLPRPAGVRYPVLVANRSGLDRAAAAGADAIAVFTAATDAFTERNIGMTVDRSLEVFGPLLEEAGTRGWWRRAYVSTAFGCPYSGRVDPARPVEVARRLLDARRGRGVLRRHDRGRHAPRREGRHAAGPRGRHPGRPDRPPLPRHPRDGPRQRLGRARRGHPDLRRLDRRHRRLSVRPGRGRQPRDGGPRLPARRGGVRARRRPRPVSSRPPGSSRRCSAARSPRRSARPARGSRASRGGRASAQRRLRAPGRRRSPPTRTRSPSALEPQVGGHGPRRPWHRRRIVEDDARAGRRDRGRVGRHRRAGDRLTIARVARAGPAIASSDTPAVLDLVGIAAAPGRP